MSSLEFALPNHNHSNWVAEVETQFGIRDLDLHSISQTGHGGFTDEQWQDLTAMVESEGTTIAEALSSNLKDHGLLTAEREAELGRLIMLGRLVENILGIETYGTSLVDNAALSEDEEPEENPILEADEEEPVAAEIDPTKPELVTIAEELRLWSQKDLLDLHNLARKARHYLVLHNQRLIAWTINQFGYLYYGIPFTDLMQVGNLGLDRAVWDYDFRQGRFSTYAVWWIRRALKRAIIAQGRVIRLPDKKADIAGQLRILSEELTQELGREPGIEELAAAMDMDVAELEKLIALSQKPLSLDTAPEPSDEDDSRHLLAQLADTSLRDPDKIADFRLLRERVQTLLDTLSEQHARVLILRYGLKDGVPLSRREIAEIMGISYRQVIKLEQQALRNLRHPKKAKFLRPFY